MTWHWSLTNKFKIKWSWLGKSYSLLFPLSENLQQQKTYKNFWSQRKNNIVVLYLRALRFVILTSLKWQNLFQWSTLDVNLAKTLFFGLDTGNILRLRSWPSCNFIWNLWKSFFITVWKTQIKKIKKRLKRKINLLFQL